MPRLLAAVCISIAVLMAVVAAACDRTPTAPNRPTGDTAAAAVRLEISGPRTVAPGRTAQFIATAHMGTYNFTAANGDQLSGRFVGSGVFIPPNSARLTEHATIENGTGRFAAATGTFTMERFDTIDFATGKATEYGSLEGQISLNK